MLRSVEACSNGEWSLALWKAGHSPNNSAVDFRPFRCKSWRHEGACRDFRNAQDFSRILEAIETRDLSAFTYVVLTFDPQDWPSKTAAYTGIRTAWGRFIKRFRYDWGETEYCGVLEQHKSEWPHLNYLLYNDRFAGHLAAARDHGRKALSTLAAESGFGMQVWCESMHSPGGMAGYLIKLLREEEELIAKEAVKQCQMPIASPPGTRRIRTSRGFLPPRRNTGIDGTTGGLVFGPATEAKLAHLVAAGTLPVYYAARLLAERRADEWLDNATRRVVEALVYDPGDGLFHAGHHCVGGGPGGPDPAGQDVPEDARRCEPVEGPAGIRRRP